MIRKKFFRQRNNYLFFRKSPWNPFPGATNRPMDSILA